MALVLLSPLNTLATHASSAASSWVSTGLTFSFPHKTQASRRSTGRTPQPSSPLSTPFLFTPRSRTGQRGRQESVNRRGHRGLHGLWRRPASKRELTLHSSPGCSTLALGAKIQLGREEGRPLCGRPLRRRGLLPQTLAAAAWPWRFGLRSGDNVVQSKEP